MGRKVFAVIEVDDDKAIAENKGTGEYLEREFGWLEQSGIVLKHWLIADDDDDERWARYINYLIEWALYHSDGIRDSIVLIVDDICSRGGTFYHSAVKLKELGAKHIILYVTHCEDTILWLD